MIDFRELEEIKLSEEFKRKGYIIFKSNNKNSLNYLREKIIKSVINLNRTKKVFNASDEKFLNNFHNEVKPSKLNSFRLKLIDTINKDKNFKKNYFLTARSNLHKIVGNELSMQTRINLSIQTPKDSSSLLPIHSDIWSGDSPFEVVVWIPLVNCYKTKAMFILPPKNK